MKTILVPVEFSDYSLNAAKYAAHLAVKTNSEIILLHVFQIPVPLGDQPFYIVNEEDMREPALHNLKSIRKKLKKIPGAEKIKIHVQAVLGNISDKIEELYKKYDCSIVLLGLNSSGHLVDILMRGVTFNLLNKADFPLLLIPENADFRPVKKIVIATSPQIKPPKDIPVLNMLINTFRPKVSLVSIIHEKEKVEIMGEEEWITTYDPFQSAAHYYRLGEDIPEEITDFAKVHKADILVLFPQGHGFWDQLIGKGISVETRLKSQIPLLAIPGH